MIRGAIFDIDGTLLDSMGIWRNVGSRYLRRLYIEAAPDLGDTLFTMTMEEGAAYLKETYHLPQSPEQIREGVLQIVAEFYRYEAKLKPDMRALLKDLKAKGIPMVLATTGSAELAEAALRREGVWQYFDGILTATELSTSKHEPKIYHEGARMLQTEPAETAVYEDVLHAVKTAKNAGFSVTAVYDRESRKDWAEIRRLADEILIPGEGKKRMKTALTIAGSDSSGGAGIQADLKTMTMNSVYGMSAITALTAQNTTGVTGIYDVTPEFLAMQLDAVFTDIYPDAVKIGMVSASGLIETIAEKLQQYQPRNVVVDPVMVATSGSKLIADDAIATLMEKLFPLADLLTPNIPEAEVLADMEIKSEADMILAAEKISKKYDCAVLCKGGHQLNDANDLLYKNGSPRWFRGRRVDNTNTHGTGCTLSSAIASNLAKGYSMEVSVHRAKTYISGALEAMLDLGAGSGPMKHCFALSGEFAKEAN